MTDIVERLRAFGTPIDRQAADEIERLRGEIELLTGNKWSEIELALADKKAHEMWMALHGIERLDDLLSDIGRLRAALLDVLTLFCACGVWEDDHPILQRARAALGENGASDGR